MPKALLISCDEQTTFIYNAKLDMSRYMNFRQNFSQKKNYFRHFRKKFAETVHYIPKGLRKGNPFQGPLAQPSYIYICINHLIKSCSRHLNKTYVTHIYMHKFINLGVAFSAQKNLKPPKELDLHPELELARRPWWMEMGLPLLGSLNINSDYISPVIHTSAYIFQYLESSCVMLLCLSSEVVTAEIVAGCSSPTAEACAVQATSTITQ